MGINGLALDDPIGNAWASLAVNNGDGIGTLVSTLEDEMGELDATMPAHVVNLDDSTFDGPVSVPPPPVLEADERRWELTGVVLAPTPLASYVEVVVEDEEP